MVFGSTWMSRSKLRDDRIATVSRSRVTAPELARGKRVEKRREN
jgi:hypothetical protein